MKWCRSECKKITADNFNELVKAFKDANHNLTQDILQKKVKQHYDAIKNKSDVDKLTRGKIGKWKHLAAQKRQKNTILSFFKK